MSDSKNDPKNLPPDDFSKTTPNIDFDEEQSDWAETPAKGPAETPADDWGKTVINYNVAEEHDDEPGSFGEKLHPQRNMPKQPEWGVTQSNVSIDDEFADSESTKGDDDYGKTTPYFRLPEVEREKYQNIPPTPTEKAARKAEENRGGIPLWFWAAAGIMTMLAFVFVIFLGLWFFALSDQGFELTIAGAKPGSRFKVDGGNWGIESEGGKYRLRGLKAGQRMIEIVNPASECTPNPFPVDGEDGTKIEKLVSCRNKAVANTDCGKSRDVAERAKCAEDALDALGNPPDLDALMDALNMLIINFDSGKSDIPNDKKVILRKAASKINQLPAQVVIEVGGHTDNVGSDNSNQALSEKRASAVRGALTAFGVRESALTIRGYGETQPIANNDSEKGRFDNRRIQYTAVKR